MIWVLLLLVLPFLGMMYATVLYLVDVRISSTKFSFGDIVFIWGMSIVPVINVVIWGTLTIDMSKELYQKAFGTTVSDSLTVLEGQINKTIKP